MERGDPIPWPTFVDFIRIRRSSASYCTGGTLQGMCVCEEIVLWLILKEPRFEVRLLYSFAIFWFRDLANLQKSGGA